MKFILRVLSALCIGWMVYWGLLCDRHQGRYVTDLLPDPTKYFQTFRPGLINFEFLLPYHSALSSVFVCLF